MPAALAPETRKNLFAIGSEVYSAYLLLDMVSSTYYISKSTDFDLNGKKISLQEYLTGLIKQGKTLENFSLGSLPCKVRLTQDAENEWRVEITSDAVNKQVQDLKPLHLCQPEDFILFCKQYPLKLSQEKSGEYKFSADLTVKGKTVRLGGPNKLNLYQLHISNLYTILTRLQDEKANLNMLVAMATGSGKSFTQALWFLVQYLADNPAFFSVPSKALVDQLETDFKRLLPTEVTRALAVIRESASEEKQPNPKWALMSHQKLLMDYWDFLQTKSTQESGLVLSFDEEHLPAQQELFNKRIQLLAENYPSLFLTATPSEEAYQASGDKPLASLSRAEKEELGISKSPITYQSLTQGTLKKSKKMTPLRPVKKLIMKFVDSIEEERLSTAHEYVDQSETSISYRSPKDPFYEKPATNLKNIRRSLRWNLQLPLGEKALVLVDKHDPVINLNLISQGQSENPYKNGNRIFRESVYDFFGLGTNLDKQCAKNYAEAKLKLRQEKCLEYLKVEFSTLAESKLVAELEDQVDFSDTQDYMNYRVLHGLIENSLHYLLGYDSKHLDYLRFHHFDLLRDEVEAKLEALFASPGRIGPAWVRRLLQEGLPLALAQEVAEVLLEVLKISHQASKKNRALIIDNWNADKKLHQLFKGQSNYQSPLPIKNKKISDFIKKHKTVFWVNGLEKTATAIESNRPFFNLAEGLPNLDSSEVRENDALKHKPSTLEAVDDTTKQAVYTPHYCPAAYTQGLVEDPSGVKKSRNVLDLLFQKGLIGTYITSEKATGFNDPNLHHVSMLIDTLDDPLNVPAQIIQGSGRNRGLNPAHQPFFFLTSDKHTPLGFPPELLEKKNYYPDFFAAKKIHQKKLTQRLGKKIALAMQAWIEANINPDGSLESEEINRALNALIIDEFEALYKINHFDFNKTRKIFLGVLDDVYKSLYSQADQLKKNYSVPRSAKVISAVLSFIAKIYYRLGTALKYFSFLVASFTLQAQSLTNNKFGAELTYAKIVRKYSFKAQVKIGVPAKRLQDLIKADADKTVEFAFKKRASRYLKPKVVQALDTIFKQDISPYLIRFMGTAQQQQELLKLIVAKNDWVDAAYPLMAELRGEEEGAISCFYTLIKRDPSINAYLSQHNLQVEPNRRERAKLETYQASDKINLFDAEFLDREACVDVDSLRDLLAKNLERYIKSGLLKTIFKKFIGPLSDKELLIVLNALYPDGIADSKNKKILAQLKDFQRDLKKLSIEKIFQKYASFKNPDQIEETDLFKILKSLNDIYDEILNCQCYWHAMDTKGAHSAGSRMPFLATNHDHPSGKQYPFWQRRGLLADGFMNHLSKKTQFITAAQESFPYLNQVDALKHQQTRKAMHETAGFFVKPMKQALKNSHPKAEKKASTQLQSLFKTAQSLGDKLRTLKSLTQDELQSSTTKDLNAVQRLRS